MSRHAKLLVVVAAIGFALRVAWLVYAETEPVSDYAGYYDTAGRLLDGWYGTGTRPPGYAGFLAGFMLVSKATWWLSLINVALSTAVIPAVWLIGRKLGSDWGALAAAGVVAVYPTFVFYAPVLAAEHLAIALMLAALIVALTRIGSRWWAGVGVLIGLSMLSRPEYGFYLPLFVVIIGWQQVGWRRVAKATAVIGTAATLTIAPWYVYNETTYGRGAGMATYSAFNVYLAHRPDGYGWSSAAWGELARSTPDTVHAEALRRAADHLRQEPAALLDDIHIGTLDLYKSPDYSVRFSSVRPDGTETVDQQGWMRVAHWGWIVLGVASIVALAVAFYQRYWRLLVPVVTVVGCNWFAFAVVTFGKPRSRISVDIALCLLVGVTMMRRYHQQRPEALGGSQLPAATADTGGGKPNW